MPKRSLLTLAAFVVLTGCGTGTGATARPSATPSATGGQSHEHKFQALKADCMKEKGFKYVAYVPSPVSGQSSEDDEHWSGDYAAMKAHRAKYGFGVFSTIVYAREMRGAGADGASANPNFAIIRDLSPDQQEAYTKAGNACDVQVIKKLTGKTVKSRHEAAEKKNKLIEQTTARQLDGDPKLVQLASAMADCLTRKGYQVTTTNPLAMAYWGAKKFGKEMHDLARQEDKGIPEYQPTQTGMGYYIPHLKPDVARPYLDKEIKVALDDLECGKDFYAAFMPKSTEITMRIEEQYGDAG
ncbi:hypothetical protein [Sphaerisporangium fuscum]|uniref:hypothetical protein n=1 Tax=Sphaerisporangium fuscum TaxID=2835868 RepID=UPI001BDC5142|nr:hypothetical protein [Sphaerisporangium fuscum]